jgi:hypothetical protein
MTPVDSSDWIGVEKEVKTPRPEAMVLLNCAAENPYDRDKCLSLLDALWECIAQKVIPLRYLACVCLDFLADEWHGRLVNVGALLPCQSLQYAWMEARRVTICTEDLDQGQTIGLSTWR